MKFSDNINEAVYLIDDKYIARYRNTPESGWDLYSSGVKRELRNNGIPTGVIECDGKNKYKAEMRRDFRVISGGKAAVSFAFNTTVLTGLYFRFYDKDGETASSVYLINGVFFFCNKQTGICVCEKNMFLGIEFDFENKTQSFLNNGKHIIKTALCTDNISHLDIGIEPHSIGKLTMLGTKLWTNFLFNDRSYTYESGNIPDFWQTYCRNGAKIYRKNVGSDDYRINVFSVNTFECPENSCASASTAFEGISSKLAFETKYHTESKNGLVRISLLCRNENVLTLTDDGECLFCGDKILKKHSVNVWQTLYTVCDVQKGICDVMLDGTKCGSLKIPQRIEYIDGIRIEYLAEKDSVFRFCDVFAHEIKPEPADYVPRPVKPEKLDYTVGMIVCSLWRNGHHRGWDPISAFYENRLLLGYYDEGIPELADWEIKYMTEHGIDFQMFCWFNSEKNSPICNTQLQEALNDGYFKAKYADEMKFCIIFEVANGISFTSESFRKYIVPYWIDYFFTNPNYMTLENKLVISAFGISKVYGMFGSPEKAKAEFEYLDDVAKSLGFDGIILICNEDANDNTVRAGIDAVYEYNHGYNGYDENSTKNIICCKKSKNLVHVIPTLSVGYNEVAWRDFRAPMMSTETMGNLLSWFKTDALKNTFGNSEWKKKLVIMSTWNEFGEGTYMSPANLNGFGYLDEIRKAFAKDNSAPHKDIVPEKTQHDRICYLYPENRTRLCAQLKNTGAAYGMSVLKRYDFDSQEKISLWQTEGFEYVINDGKLCGVSNSNDPKLVLKECPEIDLKKLYAVKIKMRTVAGTAEFGKKAHINSNSCIFYITDTESTWNETKRLYKNSVLDDGANLFYAGECFSYGNKLCGFRLDPVANSGKFEIEYIEFICSPEMPQVFIDGAKLESHYPLRNENGEFYVYADFQRRFDSMCGIMYTYDEPTETLSLYCKNKKAVLRKNSREYTVDGRKFMLSKPLEFYDGEPYLALSFLNNAFGFETKVEPDKIIIDTKL